MNIESKLSALFDYQKYEKNEKLAKVISDDANSMRLLSDDDLNMVSAAGVGTNPKHGANINDNCNS